MLIESWSPQDVAVWLESLDLAEHRQTFVMHDVRGQELLHLARNDLKVKFEPDICVSESINKYSVL